MTDIEVHPGESIESALRRFKKKIQKAGIIAEAKRRQHHEPPAAKKKRKAEAARKRKHF